MPRDVLIYGVGGAAAQIVNLALLPIFTRIFTPGEFGALDFLLTVNSIGSLIALAGLNSAVFNRYRQTDDIPQRRRLVGTALTLALVFAAIIAIAGVMAAAPVANAMRLGANLIPAVALTFIWVPINVGGTLALDLLRLEFRPTAYSVLGLGRAVFAGVIGALLAGPLRFGVAGLLSAYVVFGFVGIAVTLWLARASWAPGFQSEVARSLIRFGLPLIPTGLAYWVIAYSDRFFLIQLLGIGSVGIYAVANRVSMGVQLVLYAFEAAWWPYAYARARESGHRQQFSRIFTIVTVGTVAIAALLGIFAREILLVVTTPEFVAAYPYVGILAFSLVIHGAYGIISIGVQLGERTRHMAWTSAVAAALNVVLNLALIPAFGILGAALATLAAYGASTALLFIVGQQAYRIPYRLGVVGLISGVSVAILVVALALDATVAGPEWSPVITLAKAAIVGACVVVGSVAMRSPVQSLLSELRGRPR